MVKGEDQFPEIVPSFHGHAHMHAHTYAHYSAITVSFCLEVPEIKHRTLCTLAEYSTIEPHP